MAEKGSVVTVELTFKARAEVPVEPQDKTEKRIQDEALQSVRMSPFTYALPTVPPDDIPESMHLQDAEVLSITDTEERPLPS